MAALDAPASIQACALRATRLNADGSIAYGSTAMIITDALISFEVQIQTEKSDSINITSGCGNIAHSYSEGEKVTGYDGTLKITTPEVEFSEMLTGGTLITLGGVSIGYAAPEIGKVASNGVCLEMWSKAWQGSGFAAGVILTDGVTTSGSAAVTSATGTFSAVDVNKPISGPGIPAGTRILSVTSATAITLTANATATGTGVTLSIARPGAFWRWVYPLFKAKPGDFTLENAARENGFTGSGHENKAIGNGPLHDFPTGAPCWRMWSYFRDGALPTIPSQVGYQTLAS